MLSPEIAVLDLPAIPLTRDRENTGAFQNQACNLQELLVEEGSG